MSAAGVEHPRLRAVEAFPAQDGLICLRDPLGIADKLLLVPPAIFFACTLMDGAHSVEEIRAGLSRRFGDILPGERLREVVQQLDSALFLDSPRFAAARAALETEFRALRVRPASHAGSAYQAEPAALRAQLDAMFTAPDGPGLPELSAASGRLAALVAPHIDLRRGAAAYAWSYAELGRQCRARTFLLLGVAHNPTERTYVLTDKDFDTPLGTVRTDRDIVARLREECRYDFFRDELTHRQEHSLEFQALFLRHLYGADERLRIVPVLCSSLHRPLLAGTSPAEDPEVADFLKALRSALGECGQEVCVLAGADLSHLGRRFGQDLQMSAEVERQAEQDDRAMLEPVLAGDGEAFFRFIREEQDRRNVCGVSAIYTLLSLLEGRAPGRILRYDQAVDREAHSLVSFAALAFYR